MRGIEIPTTLPGMVEDHARGKCCEHMRFAQCKLREGAASFNPRRCGAESRECH
jgi:hypothetical protein